MVPVQRHVRDAMHRFAAALDVQWTIIQGRRSGGS